MPKWENTPPKDTAGLALRIIRTPASKPITAIVTSTDIVGCRTHFAAHRTIPCEAPDRCELCDQGHSWRWHGYVAAILTASLEHVIFEFTAAASDTFYHYQRLHNDIRGCWFQAQRPSGRPNGRVIIKAKPQDQTRLRLPDPPDLQRILCHIWGVPYQPQPTLSTMRQAADRALHVVPGTNGDD